MGMIKYIHVLTLAALLTAITIAGCAKRASQNTFNPPDITRWAAPDVNLTQLLSTEPNECLKPVIQSDDLQNIALGRMAFRSPFLLGGQASRRGLTCQACHSQGARNEHFFVIGLSKTAGTADISSFHFSSELGDEVFNPTPIPSLSDDIRNVDYDPAKPDLENLITQLITKEFTGENPSPEIKSALIQYLRQLDDSYCSNTVLTGADLLAYKIKIIDQTFEALEQNSFTPATQNFLAAALRAELGRLNSRFPKTDSVRSELFSISQSLNMRGEDITPTQISRAAQQWAVFSPNIARYYDQSIFHPVAIERWGRQFKAQSP